MADSFAMGGRAADALAEEKRAVHLSVHAQQEREMLKLGLVKPNSYARRYAMPPGVPRDRVRAVEAAFVKMLKDPEFVAEAEKRASRHFGIRSISG
jgi:hypothetical protein